jgi:hypothetical protein
MWGTLLLSAAILISGIGIGFGSTLGYLSGSKDVAETTETEPEQPTKVAIQFSEKVSKMVGLDEPQKGKIKEIMGKRFKAMHEVRKKAMEEMVAIHREISEDMRGVMTPDQFKRWEKHNEEARKRSRFRHHRWGRGPQRGDRDGRGKHGGRGWPYGQSRSRPSGMFDMFKRLDKDNNGELTKDEIEKIRGPFQQFIKKADVNGDGKVDRKEYDTQLRRHRPSSWPGRTRKSRDRKERSPSSAPAQDLSML